MSIDQISIVHLIESLNRRAARAVLGHLSLRSKPLREHLREKFAADPGVPWSFLSDPVVEAGFSFERVAERTAELPPSLIDPELVEKLNAPPSEYSEHRFSSDWRPYTHQVNSWKAAKDDSVRAYLVSSGTGSGKTECFLIPILDDLLRE